MFPSDRPSYSVIESVDWPEAITIEQARGALATIEAAAMPAEPRAIGALIAEMLLVMPKQGMADVDREAMVRIYVRELQAWPADIVLAVLRAAPTGFKWFPSLKELADDCKALNETRSALRSSIERQLCTLTRPGLRAVP